MFKKIKDLQPEKVWKYFYELTQIPRPSGYEGAVIEHIKEFAIQRNFEHHIDEAGNILIIKPGHPEGKTGKKLILQAHVDMVPQKNNDKHHDFRSDPIETIIDGDWVRADKTTLGADNGIGVAAMLAILDSKDIKHGPLETFFTVSEETGMDGVFGLKPDFLHGEILINLDSEDEREIIIGCAGGMDANISWEYSSDSISDGETFYIEVKGLKGGHSGIDINLGRANANKLLIQLLILLQDQCEIRLSSFRGGNLRNAIPREAEAVISVSADKKDKLRKLVDEYRNELIKEYKGIETDLLISINEYKKQAKVMKVEHQKTLLRAFNNCPNGVITMSASMKGIVETSTNLAIIRIGEGKCEANCLLRSSNDMEKKKLAEKIKNVFESVDARLDFEGEYPGWNPDNESLILAKAIDTYKKLFKTVPEVKVIHAGLECGIIGGKYPSLDMISFGPTIRHPHSPDEKVNIKSVERFWIFLRNLLEEI
jgi:dipeptidase D